jgi:predicted RNA methylase
MGTNQSSRPTHYNFLYVRSAAAIFKHTFKVDYARMRQHSYVSTCFFRIQENEVALSHLPAKRFRGKRLSGWSPTPMSVVNEALRLAGVSSKDLLFDLGCGDGRVVVRAAKLTGARAIGIDIDPKLLEHTRSRVAKAGVDGRVRVRQQDLLAIPDLQRASVVFMYLPAGTVNRLKPVLRRTCGTGTRIISVSYQHRGSVTGARFRSWRADKDLYLWVRRQKWNVGLWTVK